MQAISSFDRSRAVSALAAVAVQALLLWALIAGLAVHMPRVVEQGLALFAVPVDPPPKPKVRIEPAKQRIKRPEGAASPANLRNRATEVAAPEPVVPVVLPPPPVVTAPVPADGAAANTGASNVPGPGTGSGGIGDGTGSGGAGDGDGGGWQDETPPRWRSGRLRDSDYPGDLGELGAGGTVSVRYVVRTDGRVDRCRVTRSSGHAELDAITCRLIEQRFRYRPSLDARGRPVEATIVEDHSWVSEIDPNEDPRGRRR